MMEYWNVGMMEMGEAVFSVVKVESGSGA